MNTAQTHFEKYLKLTSAEIEKELNNYSRKWSDYIETDFQDLKEPTAKFTQSIFGGKMLRGTLVKLGYELFEKKRTHAILKPAIAFEIFHTSILVHDDIIDKSPVRRGKPAVYVSKNKHYGISQAICLGDLGITLSIKLLSESHFQIQDKNRALTYFLDAISTTILGEMLDIESSRKYKRSEEQIIKIHQNKTANYTITTPLIIGAVLAGGDDELLQKIRLFGGNLGIAFQIQDDILGIFGDERTVGKSITSDIEENKSTMLITRALSHANKKQKNILKRYYGKKKITSKEYEIIKQVFQETGSLVHSQNKINDLILEAKATIPSLTENNRCQLLLTGLTDLLMMREK